MKRKVVVITGVSSGLGKALAGHLSESGYIVYGTTRNLKRFKEMNGENSAARILEADITRDASITKAVGRIVGEEGGIDILVNNAGYGTAGAAEETSVEDARDQFEVNFFSVLRMTNAVLPEMRRARSGMIINVSSIVGRMGIPFQSLYCASKYALEGYSESLRMELKRLGIGVVLVEPGDMRTGFTGNRKKFLGKKGAGPYRTIIEKSLPIVERDEMKGYPPEKVAALIEKIMRKKSPRLRYSIGPLEQMISLPLKSIVPDGVFEYLVMDHLKL